MASPKELFTIPIPATGAHPGGSIVCTEPAPQVYVLTWTSPPDNRLTSAFCAALGAALDAVEFGPWPAGVLVTTSAVPRFYSNGLDLETAIATPGFFERELYPLWRRFLTYPMPTVALINGHCFAGGLMTAMHHDYRIYAAGAGAGAGQDGKGKGKTRKPLLCLNEVEFGMPLMPPMSAIFRLKTAPSVYRRLVLEAHRFDGPQALEAGIVDGVAADDDSSGLDAVLRLVRDRALTKKAATGVYGLLKAEMYKESVALLAAEDGSGGTAAFQAQTAVEKKRKADGAKWFEQWKQSQGEKAKL